MSLQQGRRCSSQDQGAHRRVAQPPWQSTKIPFPADVRACPEQNIEAKTCGHIQVARQICSPFPIVRSWRGLMQVPGHICLHVMNIHEP